MVFSYLAFVFNFLCLGIFGTFEKQVKNKDFGGVSYLLKNSTGTYIFKGCCDSYVLKYLDIGTLLLSMYCSIVWSQRCAKKFAHNSILLHIN